MKISQSGIDLIKHFEGLRLEAYQCSANVWTIGYGTTRLPSGPVQPGMRITEDQAEEYLRSDIRYFEDRVNQLVSVPVSQPQFDALVSLAYNIGDGALEKSTLLRELNNGNYQEAAEQFLRWNQADGKVNAGLVNRRTRERNLFMQAAPATQQPAPPPSAPTQPAPSIGERIVAIPALVAAAASALLPVIADLFRARGSKTSTRNAEILDQVGEAAPAIVAIAKEVSGASTGEQAAEAILASKELQQQFRAQVALKWSDLEPFLRFEEESRKSAREFVDTMTSSGPQWRQIGWGVLIGVLSLLIITGIGYTFWHVLFAADSAFSQSTRDGVVELMKNVAILVIGFFFGSSASNRQKDVTIAEQAKR